MSTSAEKALLRALLWTPEALHEAEGVSATDISDPLLRSLWRAVEGLVHDGRAATAYTVAAAAGVPQAHVDAIMGDPEGPAALPEYARAVVEARITRDVRGACAAAMQSHEGGTALLDALTSQLQSVVVPRSGELVPARTMALDTMARIEAAWTARQSDEPVGGLQTGLDDLDEILGGLVPGGVTVVAARPSGGKSALMLGILHRLAMGGTPCAYYSLEDPLSSLGLRLTAAESRLDSRHLQRGVLSQGDWQAAVGGATRWSKGALFASAHAYDTTSRLLGDIRRAVLSEGLQVVAIDYVQKCWEPGAARPGDRNGELTWISDKVQKLAMGLGIAVLLGSQLRRIGEDERPHMGHLRESGALEQNAQQIVMLHRKQAAKRAGVEVREAIVEKNKDGATGHCLLAFDAPQVHFRGAAHSEKERYANA